MLRLHDVRKSYGRAEALGGVSLTCEPGEVTALLGPNGAGKSTTIGLATGLLRPDSGTVELVGSGSPTERAVRAKIGVATQSIALYEDLSARENLRFFGRMHRIPRADLSRRASELLEKIGLGSRGDEPVRVFSGGMKRRLNLAVALIHDPELVLLDEPTAGVDPQSRNAILEMVEELGREGRCVVYSTHYMEEAQRISDRVVILDHGRVLAGGTVAELVATYGGSDRVCHESASGRVWVQTDEPLATLGALLERPDTTAIQIDRPNLETVFLNLTGRSLRDP